MPLPANLVTLARYMAGEFDNREQAIAEPVWYVHLRLWQRPVRLFTEDSFTLFAEQASIVNLDNPYRQRLLRLQPAATNPQALQVQYYSFKNSDAVSGAGQKPELLNSLTLEEIELLPGCLLNVSYENSPVVGDRFIASPLPNTHCYFNYQGSKREVSLGFEASTHTFLSYDKGVDPDTGQALWGAIMGPYRYTKRQNYEF